MTRVWTMAALSLLLASGCGGSTAPAPVTQPSAPPATTMDAGPPPEPDAGVADDASTDAAAAAALAPPNRTRDYYLRWRFDPAPVPTEDTSATYSHVFLEVHSASGMQEVDMDVTDANCHDDPEHLSRRAVLRAKCWFAGAGWELEVIYRDSQFIVRRRAVDEAMNRNPSWRGMTRIAVPPRSTVETPTPVAPATASPSRRREGQERR
ncbi:MAG: hypothetical protein IPK60_11280 [Sandaracinaceae bacterium]|nr:hypothetical protein [Sandaracinaceae bacterium]